MKRSAIIILIVITFFVSAIDAPGKTASNSSSNSQFQVDLSALTMPVSDRYITFKIPVKLYNLHEDVLEVLIAAYVVRIDPKDGMTKIILGCSDTVIPVPQNRTIEQEVTMDVHEIIGQHFEGKTMWLVQLFVHTKDNPSENKFMTQTPLINTPYALIAKEGTPFKDSLSGQF